MPVRPCVVSFCDSEGLRHSVEVQAESLYEAALLALGTFQEHDCAPGPAARLDVEVRTSVTHSVTSQNRGLAQWRHPQPRRAHAEESPEDLACKPNPAAPLITAARQWAEGASLNSEDIRFAAAGRRYARYY